MVKQLITVLILMIAPAASGYATCAHNTCNNCGGCLEAPPAGFVYGRTDICTSGCGAFQGGCVTRMNANDFAEFYPQVGCMLEKDGMTHASESCISVGTYPYVASWGSYCPWNCQITCSSYRLFGIFGYVRRVGGQYFPGGYEYSDEIQCGQFCSLPRRLLEIALSRSSAFPRDHSDRNLTGVSDVLP